jgi:hypothetical protein
MEYWFFAYEEELWEAYEKAQTSIPWDEFVLMAYENYTRSLVGSLAG